MLAITEVSNCQQKFCFLYYLFASSKVVKVFPIFSYNNCIIFFHRGQNCSCLRTGLVLFLITFFFFPSLRFFFLPFVFFCPTSSSYFFSSFLFFSFHSFLSFCFFRRLNDSLMLFFVVMPIYARNITRSHFLQENSLLKEGV